MASGAQTREWKTPSRRGVPRYVVRAPLDVTVLRSGISDTVPGRSVNLCEGGIAAMVAGELTPGETVGVEVRLPMAADPLRARALVRHQDKFRCGMEFIELSAIQRAEIRHWAEHTKAAARAAGEPAGRKIYGDGRENPGSSGGRSDVGLSGPNRMRPGGMGIFLLVLSLSLLLLAIFWWRWNRSWEQLERGLPRTTTVEQPRVQVAAEVMQKLLVHRVEPDYPDAARKARLEGFVVLDIVVGRDGSVVGMRPVSGPDVLAQSAMGALRWWKFQPYLVKGKPVVVKTTVAVEFKP
jgi:TonB family protein